MADRHAVSRLHHSGIGAGRDHRRRGPAGFGVTATVQKGLPGTSLEGVPSLLDIPLPLWQQPLFFAVGIAIVALALANRSPRKEAGPDSQYRLSAPAPQRH